MIELSDAHLAAVGRRRRIIDQMDRMTPIDLLGIPMQDYVDLRFHHADPEGSQIDGFIWDVGDGEDAYALYENERLPLLDDAGTQPLMSVVSAMAVYHRLDVTESPW